MTEHQKETKKTCNHIMHNQEPCGIELYDDEFCVFHSKNIEKKTDFNKKFEKLIAQEDYDFSGFVFPDDISFEKQVFKKKAIFQNACFSGNVNFNGAEFHEEVHFGETQFSQDVSFGETRFSKEVDFSRAHFNGKANFWRSKLIGASSFWGVQFSNRTDFGGVIFSEKADFDRTVFPGYVGFGKTQFIGNVSFGRAQFTGDANFGKTIYAEDASFRGAQFQGEAAFWEADFSQRADFGETMFSGSAFFGEAQFSCEARFVDTQFSGETNFSKARFYEKGNFRKARFLSGKKCYMEDTYFFDIIGLFEYLEEEKSKKTFSYSNKTEFLPDHFKLILGEEARAKYPIISRKISDDMYLLSFKNTYPKTHYLWWLLADCGRSFSKWAAWSLGMALFFAVIYALIGPGAFGDKPGGYTWFSFFYYSIVTFTTLGFGDITPIKWYTEILVTIEVILGYLMLGGLVSILANKLARRS